MKNLRELDEFRVRLYPDTLGDESNGAFSIKVRGERYSIIASSGGGWEHVSVSHKHKIPSWRVMCEVKDLFFREDEVVMQLHPKKSEYVNTHKNCLHLWKPTDGSIPVPPKHFV